jgi:hypothetical protein
MNALQFLVDHGASVLFLVVFVEQAGLPIPAIPLLIAAGALVGVGKMSLATGKVHPWTKHCGPATSCHRGDECRDLFLLRCSRGPDLGGIVRGSRRALQQSA